MKDANIVFPRYEELNSLLPEKRNPGILLIGTPEHWNLGDHAIAMAERMFFKDMFPEKKVYEIPGRLFEAMHSVIQNRVCTEDVIVITGGGFLGSLWIREENLVRTVIQEYPQNKVVIFPQTIFFEDTEQGNIEFGVSKKIYEKHNDLHLCLRDYKSYEFVKQNFNITTIHYFPDMVLYLQGNNYEEERRGVICCFRTDKERVLSEKKKEEIYKIVEKKGMEARDLSTVLTERFHYSEGEQYCKEKFVEFSRAELVITDRLHGMIFAAITGTPCVAFDNCSGKVSGVYEWIKNIPYLKVMKEDMDVESMIEEVQGKGKRYDNSQLMKYFHGLEKVLTKSFV